MKCYDILYGLAFAAFIGAIIFAQVNGRICDCEKEYNLEEYAWINKTKYCQCCEDIVNIEKATFEKDCFIKEAEPSPWQKYVHKEDNGGE